MIKINLNNVKDEENKLPKKLSFNITDPEIIYDYYDYKDNPDILDMEDFIFNLIEDEFGIIAESFNIISIDEEG